ncbi:MAG: ThuA domain-containing protein [Prevotellaceae bacterium]|jgi:type 1 glutamine amidotransferase|nr:ThuA domain-containing protein [Prevotellaceae bacterium]
MYRLLFLLLLCTVGGLHAQTRVLVLTERGGQHESFAVAALGWLNEQAEAHGYSLHVINNTQPITEEYLAQVALFIQLDFPPYTWSEEAKRAFEQYVDEGKGGWIGFHHATLLGDFDGWPMWSWFSDFMGGIRFKNYVREKADGAIRVEKTNHPVMHGVADTFTLPDDEWYTFDRSPRPNVQVLATVDEDSYRPPSSVKMGDHPAVWVNEAKKARNVYFLFGHSGALFSSPDFIKMFSNALQWATNRR